MDYFCVECKARHPITDIGIDLREVCLDQLKDGVNGVLDMLYELTKNDNIEKIRPLLQEFLDDDESCGRILRFKGSEIESRLEGVSKDKLRLSGLFVLRLGWLLDHYEKTLTSGSDNAKALAGCIKDLKKEEDAPIFQRVLKFSFIDVKGQRLFSHVTNAQNDPFTDGYEVPDPDSDNPDAIRTIEIQRGYLRCCPHCGKLLSPAVGQAEEIVVGLFGSPRAGKTSCLASVVSALKKGKYEGFYMQTFANDLDWLDLEPEIDRYETGRKVIKTPINQPKVPSFSFLITAGGAKRVLTMVDMPGEFWGGANGISSNFYQKYIDLLGVIDCVWLFISKLSALEYPLGTEEKRNARQQKLIEDFSEFDGVTRTIPDILDMNLPTLREKMAAVGKKLPPFACILTKPEADADDLIDAKLYELFPVDGDVNAGNIREHQKVVTALSTGKTGEYRCSLREKAFFSRSRSVKLYLEKQQKVTLMRALEKNCERRFYISMAAYGHPARDTEAESSAPTPYHQLYPLLWTLAITGALPIEHDSVYRHYNIFGAVVEKKTREETDVIRFDARRIGDFEEEEPAIRDSAYNLFMQKSKYTTTEYRY